MAGVCFYFESHDIDVWSEVMARCLSMSGLTKKDVFQNPIPYGTFTGAFGFHYGAQKIGAMIIPSGMGQSERQINLMKYYKTTKNAGFVGRNYWLQRLERIDIKNEASVF